MKKLSLNKKTISALNQAEMKAVNGGKVEANDICVVSCARGSNKGKDCCKSGRIDISASTVGGNC
jgi:natural product precursor